MQTKSLDPLYATASTGAIKKWTVTTVQADDGEVTVETCWGLLGKKMQTSSKIVHGKNIGKSNETTPWEQGLFDAQSKWNKQLDKGYGPNPRKLVNRIVTKSPMLAHVFEKKCKYIRYPAYAQPKLDGMRCIAEKTDGIVTLSSRMGKEILTCAHLVTQLALHLADGESRDGEIYVHGWTFQQIMRAVKKVGGETPKLEYHMYDVPTEGTFKDRFKLKINPSETPNLYSVPTYMIKSETEAYAIARRFIDQGYEGAIIRNADGLYKFGHRSNDLQKIKFFKDAEFRVVGVKEGTGKDRGTAIFVCETAGGKTFDPRPIGTYEQRAEYFNNFEAYRGRMLTVKYQQESEDGIPIFPIGLHFRPEEDLPT